MSDAINPSHFFDRVSHEVQERVELDIRHFQNIINERCNSANGNTKDKSASLAKINKSTEVLLSKSKENYSRNLEKFKVYATRNIFIPSATSTSSQPIASSSSSAAPADSFNPNIITPNTPAQLSARERFLALKQEHDALAWECKETEALLKDMRSTLFQLRMAAQIFDEKNVSPIAEYTANLAQQGTKLQNLCNDSTVLLNLIATSSGKSVSATPTTTAAKSSSSTGSSNSNAPVPMDVDRSIDAGDTSDLSLLNANLK